MSFNTRFPMFVRSPHSIMNSMAIYAVYLASWHNSVPEPSLVSEVTHVCLAFVSPSIFNSPDPPALTALSPFFTNIDTVRAKFAKDIKILWAIGGWGDTDEFSIAAKSAKSRKLFARNVKSLLDATNTDGVDLDWEYPGGNGDDYKQHGPTNSEKAWEIDAYPELISELRLAFGSGICFKAE